MKTIAISFLYFLLIIQDSYAQNEFLDLSFGNNGISTLEIERCSYQGGAIQSDGKIICVGGKMNSQNTYEFFVIRFKPNGSIDSTFNKIGYNTAVFSDFNDLAECVTIQPDNKILVGGYTGRFDLTDFSLVRFNSDGTIDQTFGKKGIVSTTISKYSFDRGYSTVVQEDGKIVFSGFSIFEPSKDTTSVDTLYITKAVTIRYNMNGTLDSSFGINGFAITDASFENKSKTHIFSNAIQPDGKILSAGFRINSKGRSMVILRHNENGMIDSTFATNGLFDIAINSTFEGLNSIYIQSNGCILAAGYTATSKGTKMAIIRLDRFGNFDLSFNKSGFLILDDNLNNQTYAMSIISLNDGKILVAAETEYSDSNVILVKLTNDGQIERTFGKDGFISTYIGLNAQVHELLVTNQNQIILISSGRDFDGKGKRKILKYLRSTLTTIKPFNEDSFNFQIFPNPSNLYITVSYRIYSEQQLAFKLVDFNGKSVYCDKLPKIQFPGIYNYKIIWPENISSGYYTLSISSERFLKNIKILKM